MGMIDKIKTAAEELVNKEEGPIVPQESTVSETPKEVQEEAPVAEQVTAPTVDRAAYNCPTCKGEGLVKDAFEDGGFVRCPQCFGTGKVA